jgi:hypothetical protein
VVRRHLVLFARSVPVASSVSRWSGPATLELARPKQAATFSNSCRLARTGAGPGSGRFKTGTELHVAAGDRGMYGAASSASGGRDEEARNQHEPWMSASSPWASQRMAFPSETSVLWGDIRLAHGVEASVIDDAAKHDSMPQSMRAAMTCNYALENQIL